MEILASHERDHWTFFAFRYKAVRNNYTVKGMKYFCQNFNLRLINI